MEENSVKGIFEQAQHPYTQGLIACRPRMDIRLKRLPTLGDFLQKDTKNQAFSPENQISRLDFDKQQKLIQSATPLLTVKALKTYFPLDTTIWGQDKSYVKAVDEVSLEVYPGETLGLVGESGCGKTTLGRTILRLIAAQSGEVHFRGQSLFDLSEKNMRRLRKDMQLIFQDPYSSLNPKIRVGQAIMEPMQIHDLHENDKIRKEKTLEWLQKVGLEAAHFDRYPHELSGGQRQRICIARALSSEPKFVICD